MLSLLLEAGYTQQQAAVELSVSEATISSDVNAIIQSLRADTRLTLQQKVERDEQALLIDEALFRSLLSTASTQTAQQRAYETVLSIMRRRSELLGLDATERRKLQEAEGDSEDLDALLRRAFSDGEQTLHVE